MDNKIEIRIETVLCDASVIAILNAHKTHCDDLTPIESRHRLDIESMRNQSLTKWVAWLDEIAVGIIALKEINSLHGEVKSMHVLESMRGHGIAQKLLRKLIEHSKQQGIKKLSLETGNTPNFDPAINFYKRNGFQICGYFEGYKDDPNSVFMSLTL